MIFNVGSGQRVVTPESIGALPVNGTAADASKLGGKAPAYYIRPKNLLDNSYFANPVDQRGGGYTDERGGYPIDRWVHDHADGTSASVSSDANFGWLYMTRSAGSGFYSLRQAVSGNHLKNKKFTFAIRCNSYDDEFDMNVSTETWETVTNQTIPATDGVACITFDNGDNDYLRLQIFPNANEFGIYWAALYEGEYTVDTLPPYVPKGYEQELSACLFYFERLNDDKTEYESPMQLIGYTTGNAKHLYAYLPYSAKRIMPTITAAIGGAAISGNYYTVSTATWEPMKNGAGVQIMLTGDPPDKVPAAVYITDVVDISADL